MDKKLIKKAFFYGYDTASDCVRMQSGTILLEQQFENWLSEQTANSKQLETQIIPPAFFSANDIDAAYLLGVFNTGGIDKLGSEIARLKELGKMPHEFIFLLKQS